MMTISDYEFDPDSDLISSRGATAIVYRATIKNSKGSKVALKVFRDVIAKGTESKDTSLDKLKNEFNKIEKISHTNIINYKTITFLEEQSMMRPVLKPVIVMEYASEGSLADYFSSDIFRSLSKTVQFNIKDKLIKDILKGLDHLHSEENIIHRDMKPNNILVSMHRKDRPIAKISDFGISKIDIDPSGERTRESTINIGTPHYMAPEQMDTSFGQMSHKADVWAVGVIIYWVFKGQCPFAPGANQDTQKGEIQRAILTEKPGLEGIPYPYQTIVEKCLVKEVENRISSVGEVLSLLSGDNEGAFWEGINKKPKPSASDFIEYLRIFPNGKFQEQAFDNILKSRVQSNTLQSSNVFGLQYITHMILSGITGALIIYLILTLIKYN